MKRNLNLDEVKHRFVGGDGDACLIYDHIVDDEKVCVMHIYTTDHRVLPLLLTNKVDEIHVYGGGGYGVRVQFVLDFALSNKIPVYVHNVASAGCFYAAYRHAIFCDDFYALGHFFQMDEPLEAIRCWFLEIPRYFTSRSDLYDASRYYLYIDAMKVFALNTLALCAKMSDDYLISNHYIDVSCCFLPSSFSDEIEGVSASNFFRLLEDGNLKLDVSSMDYILKLDEMLGFPNCKSVDNVNKLYKLDKHKKSKNI